MDKRCPYCGGEMLLGYMQSRDGVYWSMKKKLVPALPGLAKDELYLSAAQLSRRTTARSAARY